MHPKELLNTFSCSMPLPNSSRAFLTLLLDNATSYSPSCNANLERHDQEFLLIPFTTAFALMTFVPPNLLQIKTPEFLPFYRPHFPRSFLWAHLQTLWRSRMNPWPSTLAQKNHCSVQSQTPYTSKLLTPVFPFIFKAQLSLWGKNYCERDHAEFSLFLLQFQLQPGHLLFELY